MDINPVTPCTSSSATKHPCLKVVRIVTIPSHSHHTLLVSRPDVYITIFFLNLGRIKNGHCSGDERGQTPIPVGLAAEADSHLGTGL